MKSKRTRFSIYALCALAACFATVSVFALASGTTFDAAADFSPSSNPAGAWSYGWSTARGTDFNLYGTSEQRSGLDEWAAVANGLPALCHNGTAGTINPAGTNPIPAGALCLHPGPGGENSILRWTAPSTGLYRVAATFEGLDTQGTTTDVAVLHGATQLFSGDVTGYLSTQSFTGDVSVIAGETIDFTVGFGSDGNYSFDTTGLSVTIVTDTTPPVTIAAPSPTPNASNWYNQNVTVTLSATDESEGSGVKQITYSATGAQTISQITVAGASTVVVINIEGTTTLSYYATDNAGNNETAHTLAIMLDKAAPSVVCGSADGLWHATDVNIPCTASDGGSGLSNSGDASFSLSTSVTANTETNNAATNTRQVCDVAGNCTTAGPISGNKVDKRAPTISMSSPTATTYHLSQLVTAQYSCSDSGSGVATCAGTVANGSPIDTSSTGTKSFSVTSTDNVGNGSSQTVTYTVAAKPPNGAPTADLAVSMTSDAPTKGVASGSNITYTITLRNKGPNAASGVALVDDIPTGMSFVSATGSYSLVAGGTTGTRLVVNVGTMNNGASVTVTLVVKVNAASGSTVTNSAVVSANTYDPVNGNNTAVISTKIR